jgi:hypothetical protein
MRMGCIALVIVACLASGCWKPTPSYVEIKIDGSGQCVVDDAPCSIKSLMAELNMTRQRSGGLCSVGIICDPIITSSIFFQVVDQAAELGIWKISLQIGETSKVVDCSRPAPDPFQQTEEVGSEEFTTIIASANTLSVDGTDCALSDLDGQLKNKGGIVIVKARPDSSIGTIHAVLDACESMSLQASLFGVGGE